MKRTFLLLTACLIAGCQSMPRELEVPRAQVPDEAAKETAKAEEPAKTLFEWKVGEKKEETGETPKDVIVTDRPDFTEASSTVGKGRAQLEAGYTHTFNRLSDGSRTKSNTYPEALLRLGLFEDWFELRLGQTYTHFNDRVSIHAIPTTGHGYSDLYVGSKIGLAEQRGVMPELAMIVAMTVPSGSPDTTSGKVLPTASLLYGWDITEKVTFGGSTVVSQFVEEDKHSAYTLAQSLTVGYAFTDKIGSYLEPYAFFPTSATGPGVKPQYYLNGGLTYKPVPLVQLDIRAGVGLNSAAADLFVGAGLSVKY